MTQLDLVSPNRFAVLEDPEQEEAKMPDLFILGEGRQQIQKNKNRTSKQRIRKGREGGREKE